MIKSSLVYIETRRISNGLKFALQCLLEIFEVFEQEVLLKENEIMSNFLHLSIVENLVDYLEPRFFEKDISLVIMGLYGYLIIADLEFEVEFLGCGGIFGHKITCQEMTESKGGEYKNLDIRVKNVSISTVQLRLFICIKKCINSVVWSIIKEVGLKRFLRRKQLN